MKRVLISCVALLATIGAAAQQQSQAPAAAPAQQQPAATQPAAPPAGKTPPQAKSQEEFKAYQEAQAVVQQGDPAKSEAAVDAFAAKFKGTEIGNLLYHSVMLQYQNQNNAEKAIETGNKILATDPNDPVANVMVATFISERVRETDIDRDQRLAEAEKDAKKALQTIDTDFMTNPGTPQEKIDESKNMMRSMAYTALAIVESTRLNNAGAENYFKQAVSVPGAQIDGITWLRYALLLDKEKKYSEALGMANKAFDSEPAGSQVRELAANERQRLMMLLNNPTGAKPATAPAGQPQGQTATPASKQ